MSTIFSGALFIATLVAAPAFAADSYSIVYSFQGRPDGMSPMAGLTNAGGMLYGTTQLGGSMGQGTVFSLTTGGAEAVVYSFQQGTGDGSGPVARLIFSGGVLWGTTEGGGAHDRGIVFNVTPEGSETLVHSFKGSDGKYPAAGLLSESGMLYGTTRQGGSADKGVVFAMTKRGKETVLHSFLGHADGWEPVSALTDLGGVLYGTTFAGAGAESCSDRCGSVYAITFPGSETVLHAFQRGGTDGAWPLGALLTIDGALYGTTYGGGANDTGTIYSVTPEGVELLVYSFPKEFSGLPGFPAAGLLRVGNVLYGTTQIGKTDDGEVFKLLPDGRVQVLHIFKGGSDGATPVGELINLSGTLYGVTSQGGGIGCGGKGCGTIFKITRQTQ